MPHLWTTVYLISDVGLRLRQRSHRRRKSLSAQISLRRKSSSNQMTSRTKERIGFLTPPFCMRQFVLAYIYTATSSLAFLCPHQLVWRHTLAKEGSSKKCTVKAKSCFPPVYVRSLSWRSSVTELHFGEWMKAGREAWPHALRIGFQRPWTFRESRRSSTSLS